MLISGIIDAALFYNWLKLSHPNVKEVKLEGLTITSPVVWRNWKASPEGQDDLFKVKHFHCHLLRFNRNSSSLLFDQILILP